MSTLPKNNTNSALEYIRSCITAFTALKGIALCKNKTKKILACIDTIDIFTQRLKATESVLVCGGNDSGLKAGGLEVQRAIYNNVLEYWSDILGESNA